MAEPPLLLTPPEAAKRLGIGLTQLNALMKQGEIPTLRIGRLRRLTPADLEAFVTRKQREARRKVREQLVRDNATKSDQV